MPKEKLLTQEQRLRIWRAIRRNMHSDDRDPEEIIKKDYGGDEDAYLRIMARWHDVKTRCEN